MLHYMVMGELSFKSDPLIIGCGLMTANGYDAGFKYPVDVEEGESSP